MSLLFPFPRGTTRVGTHPESGQCFSKILDERFRIIDFCIDSGASCRCGRFDLVELKFMCDVFDNFR